MKKYIIYTAAALMTLASCSKELDTQSVIDPAQTKNHISFNIAFPSGDPVHYQQTREIQTSREKSVQRLDIYMFDASGLLDGVYEDVTFSPSGTKYNATIQVDGNNTRDFLFVANNIPGSNTEVMLPTQIGITTKTAFKAAASPSMDPLTGRITAPLMMTSELTGITPGGGTSESVVMERIMARFDIRNYETALTLTSFEFKNAYDMGNLFNSGYPAGVANIDYPSANLPTAVNAETADIQLVKESDHTHLKHVIYSYPAPVVANGGSGPMIVLKGYVTFSGGQTLNVSYDVPLKKQGETDYIQIKRNHRYTLVIASAFSGLLRVSLIAKDLDNDKEITYDLESQIPGVTPVLENGASFVSDVLTVSSDGYTYDFEIDPKSIDWVVTYRKGADATDDFSTINWVDVAMSKSDASLELNDRLSVTLTQNGDMTDRVVYLRVVCKADPHKFYEFKLVQQA